MVKAIVKRTCILSYIALHRPTFSLRPTHAHQHNAIWLASKLSHSCTHHYVLLPSKPLSVPLPIPLPLSFFPIFFYSCVWRGASLRKWCWHFPVRTLPFFRCAYFQWIKADYIVWYLLYSVFLLSPSWPLWLLSCTMCGCLPPFTNPLLPVTILTKPLLYYCVLKGPRANSESAYVDHNHWWLHGRICFSLRLLALRVSACMAPSFALLFMLCKHPVVLCSKPIWTIACL